MRRLFAPVVVAALLAVAPAGAAAAPSLVKVDDFDNPVHVAGPPGDPSRLFVVQQRGLVSLVVNGQTMATPFLDLTKETLPGEERGLLSIAFPPDYATTGDFYVFLTARGSEWGPGVDDGDIVILGGHRSAADPNVADGTRWVVDVIDHPASWHNGGQLAFGPDGALYASVGDGFEDPTKAKDPSSPLGKILRFAEPSESNPPVHWASGLRNPWRFSFDRLTGALTIGDVGEETFEEIDFVPFATAQFSNFGWPDCEARLGDCAGSVDPALVLPAAEDFQAVIGGFVVRDPDVPSLAGRYVFADLIKSTDDSAIYSADLGARTFKVGPSLPTALPRSFGEDGCGHVYVATISAVYRLSERASGGCVPPVGGQQPPPGGGGTPTPPGTVDTQKPRVVIKRGKLRVRAFVLKLRADEDAHATITAHGYRSRSVQLAPGVWKKVTVKAKRKTIRKVRGKRHVVRKTRVRVIDVYGNITVRRPRVQLR